MSSPLDLFNRAAAMTSTDGWGTSHGLQMKDNKFEPVDRVRRMDRMWGQAFYALWVSSLEESERIRWISKFCQACEAMLKATGGVWLRNITAVDEWKADVWEWEASKDQLVGLVAALVIFYQSTSHSTLQGEIQSVARHIDIQMAEHRWTLWNEPASRANISPNYAWVHYWGISAGLSFILGRRRLTLLDLPLKIMGWLLPKLNVLMMVKVKNRGYWWQNIKALMKFDWYGDYFRAGMYNFNLNLVFFEFLIRGTTSKWQARRILRLLASPEALATNNVNFGALYLALELKWGFPTPEGVAVAQNHWVDVCHADDLAHGSASEFPFACLPNGLGIGVHTVANDESSLWSHEIFPLVTADDVAPRRPGSQLDLALESEGAPVW